MILLPSFRILIPGSCMVLIFRFILLYPLFFRFSSLLSSTNGSLIYLYKPNHVLFVPSSYFFLHSTMALNYSIRHGVNSAQGCSIWRMKGFSLRRKRKMLGHLREMGKM